MSVYISGIRNNPEAYQQWAGTMHQGSQFLAKTLVMAQLEKGDNGNENCDLLAAEIQQPKKNVESVVEAFENLLKSLDVEDNYILYMFWFLRHTRYSRSFDQRYMARKWKRNLLKSI